MYFIAPLPPILNSMTLSNVTIFPALILSLLAAVKNIVNIENDSQGGQE
jgi:hypothetical protein